MAHMNMKCHSESSHSHSVSLLDSQLDGRHIAVCGQHIQKGRRRLIGRTAGLPLHALLCCVAAVPGRVAQLGLLLCP